MKTVTDVLLFYWNIHYKDTAKAKRSTAKDANYSALLQAAINGIGHCSLEGDDRLNMERFTKFIKRIEKTKNQYGTFSKPDTINGYITLVKAAFNKALEYEKIAVNPVALAKKKPPENIQYRIVAYEEFARIWNVMPDHLKLWLEFIFKIPTRRQELLNVRKKHINPFERTITLEDKYIKTKVGRVLPIPKSMQKSFFEHFGSLPLMNDYFFSRPEKREDGTISYNKLRGQGVLQTLQRAADRVKIRGLNVHAFRRTAAVNLLRKNVTFQ